MLVFRGNPFIPSFFYSFILIFVARVISEGERDEGEKGFVEMTLKFIV